jgi:hypothetical protein
VDLTSICVGSNYHPIFWFVAVSAFFSYGVVFGAIGIASGFIQEKYGFTNVSAGFLLVNCFVMIVVPSNAFYFAVFPSVWSSSRQMWYAIN